MAGLLYIDTSSLMTVVLEQSGHEHVRDRLRRWESADGSTLSSRLLWLEARRVVIRERSRNVDIGQATERALATIQSVVVSESIWSRAEAIPHHVRSLDAIHLATCEATGAHLLTAGLDVRLLRAAIERHLPLF